MEVFERMPMGGARAAARFPRLVVSGGWNGALEAVCEELACGMGASRVVVRGAGHDVVRHGSDGHWRVQVPPEHEPVGSVARGAIIRSNPIW